MGISAYHIVFSFYLTEIKLLGCDCIAFTCSIRAGQSADCETEHHPAVGWHDRLSEELHVDERGHCTKLTRHIGTQSLMANN